jgi:hypothetical protein
MEKTLIHKNVLGFSTYFLLVEIDDIICCCHHLIMLDNYMAKALLYIR